MSIFNDYEFAILHHQTEQELIRENEHNRLARELRESGRSGTNPRQARPWWWRLRHPIADPAPGLAH